MNKSIKITSDKQCEMVQEELFRLGYKWNGGQTHVLDNIMSVGEYIKIKNSGGRWGDRRFGGDSSDLYGIIHLKDLKEM